MIRRILKHIPFGFVLLSGAWSAFAIGKPPVSDSDFVDITSVDPSILVELRYASPNNVARRPLYPPGTPALVMFCLMVAERITAR